MSVLPSGTVSLLFSDIEGSTALLKRLGVAYAAALDGQRQVLRRAWADHGGIELGTEGDSFYVVFPTAEGAVAAAAQGQRELADFAWPGGEQVRVRMGIHTGSPAVHDGAYVGMDVHRAARIAGAAHGGQVLLSSATAELVTDCLPEQVTVKDLGSHQLKDITNPEHLFQLTIVGVPSKFPPPKTLGTASSLPRPATPLVGRDGELAELTELLSSPEVRLVTLTGPGGSGKTRLAVGVAERLVDRFPDGIHFVSLAAAATADAMWSSISEVLDVPPEGRIPPGFFEHVAHKTALFVLDNLEQIAGADWVVAELLEQGPQVVVIATSRRPLNVPGERQHAVPPLELPAEPTLEEAERSGAVQLFVQHAKAVKASFTLTASNAADVCGVCRRLDGLPLAIELAAARTKLLAPAGLLSRLDKALDIASASSLAEARQKTMRDTIAWSYLLLNPVQQRFFRWLGVFAGGAALEAVTTVTNEIVGDGDPLDLVADLVDASLVTIGEDHIGEPRIGMLETIRDYALDQLRVAGEDDTAHHAHAAYYLTLAEQIRLFFEGSVENLVSGRSMFELEHDNFRGAFGWALADVSSTDASRTRVGVQLAAHLGLVWWLAGYLAEGRELLQRATTAATDQLTLEHGRCLIDLGNIANKQGDHRAARDYLGQAVEVLRQVGEEHELVNALAILGPVASIVDDVQGARQVLEEAIYRSGALGDDRTLAVALMNLGYVEAVAGQLDRALEVEDKAVSVWERVGDAQGITMSRLNRASTLRQLGRTQEAHQLITAEIPTLLQMNNPETLMTVAEDYGAVLSELGRYRDAVRLLGAADTMRERNGYPREPGQETGIAEPFSKARAALDTAEWDQVYQLGSNTTVEDALTEAHSDTVDLPG